MIDKSLYNSIMFDIRIRELTGNIPKPLNYLHSFEEKSEAKKIRKKIRVECSNCLYKTWIDEKESLVGRLCPFCGKFDLFDEI